MPLLPIALFEGDALDDVPLCAVDVDAPLPLAVPDDPVPLPVPPDEPPGESRALVSTN